jgi:ERCC4-type nuclease
LPRKTLLAAMVSLNQGKGFSVMRTESIEQTAEFVQVMQSKLDKILETGPTCELSVVTKKERRDKITPENIDTMMLTQIPFVSEQTANAVLAKFKTVNGVVEALKADPNCLAGLVFENSGRKISSKSLESLGFFLNK